MGNLIKAYIQSLKEIEDRLRQMKKFDPIKIVIRAIQIGGLAGIVGISGLTFFTGIEVYNIGKIINSSANVNQTRERIVKYREDSSIDDLAGICGYSALGGIGILGAGVIGSTQYISYRRRREEDK